MNPIQILMDEHRLIERMLDALESYARSIEKGAELPAEDLGQFVAFIRGFADAHHHGKEEDILFQAMVANGMPLDTGPLAVMLHEHVEGRGYTGMLADLAEKGSQGDLDEGDRAAIDHAATSYVNLLRAHIQKEDQILYPMADQMLPESAWTEIESQFASFESNAENAERAAKLRKAAAELADRYGG